MPTKRDRTVPNSRYGLAKLAILDLRAKGYSYSEIVAETGYSKGLIAYHLGRGQKEKTTQRTKKYEARKRAAGFIKTSGGKWCNRTVAGV